MLVEVAAGQMPNLLRFFSSMDFMSEDLAKRVGLVGMRAVRSVKPTDAESFCDYLLEEINHLASSVGTLYQAQDSALQTVGGLSASMDALKVGHSQASTYSQLVQVVTDLAIETDNEHLINDLKAVTIQ